MEGAPGETLCPAALGVHVTPLGWSPWRGWTTHAEGLHKCPGVRLWVMGTPNLPGVSAAGNHRHRPGIGRQLGSGSSLDLICCTLGKSTSSGLLARLCNGGHAAHLARPRVSCLGTSWVFGKWQKPNSLPTHNALTLNVLTQVLNEAPVAL